MESRDHIPLESTLHLKRLLVLRDIRISIATCLFNVLVFVRKYGVFKINKLLFFYTQLQNVYFNAVHKEKTFFLLFHTRRSHIVWRKLWSHCTAGGYINMLPHLFILSLHFIYQALRKNTCKKNKVWENKCTCMYWCVCALYM